MKDQSTLIHLEYESDKNYDTVIAAFEAATGTITGDEFRQAVAASGGNLASFEARIRAFEGSSAFMRFLDVDHSAWMKILGIPGRSRLYILGNPLIAATMARHDLGAGLNVPVRVLIYVKPNSGRTWLAYDLPSSLMARLGNNEIDKAAIKLDEKLAALAEIARKPNHDRRESGGGKIAFVTGGVDREPTPEERGIETRAARRVPLA